ncbi:LysR family transcriptional regulator [Alteromonas gracilis]|uniref:LysR family transcriptional regulator n=1 Tax=Alteromonas gracilis TaxID=1479524 RepID=UPI0030D293BF
MHKISLEQWRMFIAVVDNGGFAQAGDALYKTQSTISHGIKKLESTIGNPLFDIVGRKAILTDYGESLLNAARTLVSHADLLEHDAISQQMEIRSSLNVAVDVLFPQKIFWQSLSLLEQEFPELNIQVYETALSRCSELLEDGTADIGIASTSPTGFTSNLITTVDLCAVANVKHALSGRDNIPLNELEEFRQVVIRDAGLRNNVNSGWLGSVSRLTVSNFHQAWNSLENNIGFAWLPLWFIQEQQSNNISMLSLKTGHVRTVAMQLAVRPEIASSAVVTTFTRYLSQKISHSDSKS